MKTKTLIKTFGIVATAFAITLTTATSLSNEEKQTLSVNAAEVNEAAQAVASTKNEETSEIELSKETQGELEGNSSVKPNSKESDTVKSTNSTNSTSVAKATAKKYTTQATTYEAIMARIPEIAKREFGGVVIPKVWDTVDWAYGYVIYGQNKIYLKNAATKNNDYVVTHEMAHIFAGRTGADLTSKWVEIFNKEWKSGYGATNQKEAFADSFAALLVPRKANLLNEKPLSSQYVQELIGWLPRTSLTSEVNVNRTFAQRNGQSNKTTSAPSKQTSTSKNDNKNNTAKQTTQQAPKQKTQSEIRAEQYKSLKTYSPNKVLNVYSMSGVSIGRQSGPFKVENMPNSVPLGGFNWVKVYLSEQDYINNVAHKIELNHDGSTGLREAYRAEQAKIKQQEAEKKREEERQRIKEEQDRKREEILAQQEAERQAQQSADIETNN